MALYTTWSQFRLAFGIGGSVTNQLLGSTATTMTFSAGPPPVVTRAAGSFIFDKHVAGMYTDITGTALNDGRYLLVDVQALQLTFSDDAALQAEVIASTATSVYRDVNQVVSYPSELHPTTNLVRLVGFTDTITGIAKPYIGVTMNVSCNGGAPDAVYGVHRYHWYLSQRTDDPAKQFLAVAQKPDAGLSSYSGSITIGHTALATSELGISGAPDMNQVRELFKMCDLYCKQVSDGGIQYVNLYREMMMP